MKLPFSFNFNKKEQPEYLLSLLLKDEKASVIMVEKLAGAIRVISSHEEYFKDSIESLSQEELLEVLDKTISTAEEALPPNIEVKKTIFGVKENWANDTGIKKDYLEKLKFVSNTLDLVPIGFLVITEAIAHALQKEEGAPVSAILVDPGKKHVSVSLLRAGRIIETQTQPIGDSIVKTTDQILHSFTQYEILPSRIIIAEGNENLHQQFISHSWSKTLPFLHVPQITTLPKDFEAKAVLVGTATQMGLQIASEKVPKEESAPIEPSPTHENFGFVTGKDIVGKERQDVKVIDNREKEVPYEKKTLFFENAKRYILIIISLLLKGVHRLGRVFSAPQMPMSKFIFIPPIVIIIILIFTALYIFTQKAIVTLTVKPKVIEKNQAVTIATAASSDLAKNIIAGQFLEVSEDGSTTLETTGTKEIGEKAKGEVTSYSRFAEEKTLSKGTILTSSNNLEFTLDDNISFASSSADASSPPITKKAAVTAKNIGKEGNLPSGVKFTVGTFEQSLIIAKNDTAFSGGSKKEVVAVSKNDLTKLTEKLPKELESKAKEALNKQLSQNSAIVPVFIKTTLTKSEFDKKEGEETKTVTLTGTVAYQTVSYKKSDLEELASDLLKRDLKSMSFDKNKITYQIKNPKLQNKDEVSATSSIKAFLLPDIDNQKLKESLSARSFDEAKEILKKLPQVEDVDISLSPNLPFLPSFLPRLSNNITLVLQTNE